MFSCHKKKEKEKEKRCRLKIEIHETFTYNFISFLISMTDRLTDQVCYSLDSLGIFKRWILKKTFWLTCSLKSARFAKKNGEKSSKIALKTHKN